MLKGTGVSAGVGLGTALVLAEQELDWSGVRFAGEEAEKQRLAAAAGAVSEKLEAMAAAMAGQVGEHAAEILAGQSMMLADPFMRGQMEEKIAGGATAEAAVDEVCGSFMEMFGAMEDELMRQRATDIGDLRARLLKTLLGIEEADLANAPAGSVLVARDFTPSMTVGIRRENVAGIVTEVGGATSHSAILARALEIPAVLGVPGALGAIATGQAIALDGERGHVYVEPDERTRKDYEQRKAEFEAQRQLLKEYMGRPTVTAEGRPVALYANIGSPKDAQAALEKGAEGIGLFRTEFLFMDRAQLPTEEEQLAAYRQAAALFAGREVVIRTLDVGGDKAIPYLHMEREENPFLGHRAIRYCLDEPEIYLVQLRALLRAGADHKNIKIMLPLVTGVEELRAAKALLERAKQQLAAEGLPHDAGAQVGVMIETPAAALAADILAQEAAFFSIGTNDLTQYTLAVDRGNPAVAKLYTPFHPAVLRSIRGVIEAGRAAHIPVGMCGEAAADPKLIPLLLAWGLDEFSVSPSAVLATRRTISLWSTADAAFAAGEAMKLSATESIVGCLESLKKK
ncbi:phosphoenolpyruvate--protein phosphotransferase [Allofournierella sp.]|uniref:phosphoenolpyruvate--protein phosphotransferase n=1 Tax=Allofournierella sp. TaxID=1940256 RepID=UPI003AB876AA